MSSAADFDEGFVGGLAAEDREGFGLLWGHAGLVGGQAVDGHPAIAHPDDAGRYVVSDAGFGIDGGAVVDDRDGVAVPDAAIYGIGRADPELGAGVHFGERGEGAGLVVEAVERG